MLTLPYSAEYTKNTFRVKSPVIQSKRPRLVNCLTTVVTLCNKIPVLIRLSYFHLERLRLLGADHLTFEGERGRGWVISGHQDFFF